MSKYSDLFAGNGDDGPTKLSTSAIIKYIDDLMYGDEGNSALQEIIEFLEKIFAELTANSRKAIISDLKQYFSFCLELEPVHSPFSPDFSRQKELLRNYVMHLCDSDKKQSVIRRHLVSISKLLRTAGIRNPLKESEEICQFVKFSLKRCDERGVLFKPVAQKQALPLDDNLLEHINTNFKVESLHDARNLAVLNFCADTLLGGSGIKLIEVSDLDRDQERCYVRSSGIDNTKNGCYRHVSQRTFVYIDAWLQVAGIIPLCQASCHHLI